MRASEALMLGSLILRPVPGTRKAHGGKGGCALGMISRAQGKYFNMAEIYFPWLVTTEARIPCTCPACPVSANVIYVIIIHLFDKHVFGRQDWTITQLAEWLDSVDPTSREDKCLQQSQPGSSQVQSLVQA